jgi:hypothetical protein
MPSLSYLTTGELGTVETAAETLVKLHDKHEVLDPGLYVMLSALLADVHEVQENHASAEIRHKIAQAARRTAEHRS